MDGEVGPPLPWDILVGLQSFRWSLVGPDVTVVIPADRAHFVISLTSTILITQGRTYTPHHVIRGIAWIIGGGGTAKGTWLETVPWVEYAGVIIWLAQAVRHRYQRWQLGGEQEEYLRRRSREEWNRIWPELTQWLTIPVSGVYEALGSAPAINGREVSTAIAKAWVELQSAMRQWLG